ncbi:hypothetical protein PISMIDRAFT_11218 [Pisolithus microcarpus 441]|uniref:Uncharacterized protein n=1 Tax=Pisolithus microcarpus 441 TaxID=765257 RepID=A0A0C9ZAG1_9AGAM|nr:hypothetical protein PISMIDRAFT_11218 [Pisolithus microcarpus 441]
MLDECTNALDAPGEGSQWASDEAAESRDLPESSPKTLDSVGNAVGQASVRQQMPIEDSQCLVVDNETIANVPDPPTTHYELPTSRIESPTSVKYAPTRTHSATSTDFVLPVSEPTPKEPDKLKGGDWHDDGAGGGCPDSHRVRKSMPTGNRGQDTKCKAKRLDHSPAPPTPLPKCTGHVIRPYRVPRRRGRLKSSTESISGTRTRQNAYHTRAGPMRLLLPLSTSKKRITFTAGGPQQGAGVESKMTKLGIRAINTKTSEMRGNLPLSEMRPKEPGKTKETGGGGDGTVSSEFADSHRIKKSMLADIRSQQGKLETKRPNGSPAPSKPTRNDFSHPPGTIRDPRRRGRIKTDLRNVHNAEARGRNASILTIPILPPCELARTLWNVANTYWRHGIPPEHTHSVDKPLLFQAAASQQRHKAEDERTANGFPKWKLQQRGASNTTKHRPYSHGLEALLAEACTLIYWIYY